MRMSGPEFSLIMPRMNTPEKETLMPCIEFTLHESLGGFCVGGMVSLGAAGALRIGGYIWRY